VVRVNTSELAKVKYTRDFNGLDPFAFWYKCLEELGENVTFSIGVEKNKELSWSYFDHKSFDGISALDKFFKDNFEQIVTIPTLDRNLKKPPFFELLKGVFKFSLLRKLPYLRWKKRSFTKGLTFKEKSKSFFTINLDQNELCTLKASLKSRSSALSPFLLVELSELLGNYFLFKECEKVTWMLTVNMRKERSKRMGGVQSSFFDFIVDRSEDVKQVQKRLKNELALGSHWMAWKAASLLPKISRKSCFKVVKKHIMHGGPPYIGIYSNLGTWDIKNFNSPYFNIRGNVSRTRPISVILITVNGKMTITFSFHETLPVGDDFNYKLQELKEKWIGVEV